MASTPPRWRATSSRARSPKATTPGAALFRSSWFGRAALSGAPPRRCSTGGIATTSAAMPSRRAGAKPNTAAATRRRSPKRLETARGGGAQLVRRVGFFLDELGAGELVDLALGRRAPVIGSVDAARELDKRWPEIAPPFAVADVVLDPPQRLVDRAQLGFERCQRWRGGKRRLEHAGQRVELAADIGELAGIPDLLGLDLENRNLVDRFADRYGYLDPPPHRHLFRLVWRYRSPHHSRGESDMRTSEPKPH